MPLCGSGGLVCSSYLLIRRAQGARCQAETPPIVLSKIPEPALSSSEPAEGKEQVMGFLADWESARKEKLARRTEPWRLPLARLRGVIGDGGVERVTTQNVFDVLQIPQRRRGAGACRRLAKVMVQLGWTAVRVRGVTPGG